MRHPSPRQDKRQGRTRTIGTVLVVLAFAFVAFAVGHTAQAHDAGRSDEHGTLFLFFEETEEGCEVTMEARHVPVDEATLTIERPVRKGVATDHEEELEGEPEEEGEGFRFEAGPFSYEADPSAEKPFPTQHFVLHWDDREHALSAEWSGEQCASDAYLRIYEDPDGDAVTEVDGCSFFVEGRHVRSDEGRVVVEEFHGDGEFTIQVTENDTEEEEDGVGHRFLVGPVEVDLSGRHTVRYSGEGDDEAEATLLHLQVNECSTEEPECPENVEVHEFEERNTLTWDAVQDAQVYRLYRGPPGGELSFLFEVGHPLTAADDNDADPDEEYDYRVTAVNEIGESEDCPRVSTLTEVQECPPVTLTAIANDDESVTIRAEGLDTDATLMRASGGGEPMAVAGLDAEDDTFRDMDTEAGVTYTYSLVIDGETCAQTEVTAIPVFSSALAGGLVMAAGLVGYVAMRRRR